MAKLSNKGGIFSSITKKKPKRSTFNLSHDVKLSLDMGYCVPHYIQECVPGDNITINSSAMLRFAPLISPVMHKVDVKMEFFFVPNRILWPNWETFITGSKNGRQLTAEEMPEFPYIRPYQEDNGYKNIGSLMDYLGLPTVDSFDPSEVPSPDTRVNALPFAAYQRIWDEYYRDQNLQDSIYDWGGTLSQYVDYNGLPDGEFDLGAVGGTGMMYCQPRNWEHDYFTSALPWAQKGEAVSIPMDLTYDPGESGPENWNRTYLVDYPNKPGSVLPMSVGDPMELGSQGTDPNSNDAISYRGQTGGARWGVGVDNTEALSNVATINDLRAAFKLQEWLETNARGGTRYFESIYAHFGVSVSDKRLQRPEFIGSHRSNMVISEVLQTSSPQSDDDTPQANMSGAGKSVSQSRLLNYYTPEHGYIIGIMSVLPRTAYLQGIERHWSKIDDKLQYYFPEFAHLGEQAVKNKEIYAGGDYSATNDDFGYTPRYSEYKFINSRVCGDFRDTLRFWHLGRYFENSPVLNGNFLFASEASKRIFAVQSLPGDTVPIPGTSLREFHCIYAHVFHDVKASRLMPKYGNPGL